MKALSRQLTSLEPDDEPVETSTLTPRRERFAQLWALHDNQAAAYRGAYNVQPKTSRNAIWVEASRIAAVPAVRARYNELREQALNETMMSLRAMLQWQIDIATADPNEIVRVVAYNCRHCHGTDHLYQWLDEAEFLNATREALDKKKELPNEDGGYGFSGTLEPKPECPHCLGRGIEQVQIADTTKLQGNARKLYAGASVDRYGVVTVKLHDQQAAWDKVLRMRGGYKDSLDLRTPAQRAAEAAQARLPDNITIEDASKVYIALLG